jgi:LAS superfamily LD-carboxypeptidase LdcB
MKTKTKVIITAIILIIIGLLCGVGYYFYSSKTLLVKIDNNIEVSINNKVYNTDYIKVIANGEILTKKEQIDTTKVGEQVITIKVRDYFNKEKEYSYKLNVYDKESPVITFKKEHITEYNTKIDLLKDVEAVDNSNEEITVTIEGEYDITKSNIYKLYYVAKDSTGNETREEFSLKVKEKPVQNTSSSNTSSPTQPDKEFTTSKGFKGYTKNGMTYIDGILIANKTYSLPSTYKPGGLTSTTNEAFKKMQAAAKLDGISLVIKSGYRSYATQKSTYNYYVSRDGKTKADTYSARPGHSEHQTGLAMDLNIINDTFHNTKEAKWLASNCYKYGFILRYPKGKTNETGYKYESWHFRYVGVDLATKLYNNGDWITLESYFGITSQYN